METTQRSLPARSNGYLVTNLYSILLEELNPKIEEPRSPKWHKLREQFLKNHDICAVCGTKHYLEVHHIVPFHINKTKELVVANLITLCESPTHNCHLLFGHLLNWHSYNPDIIIDADWFKKKIIKRI